jgi:hypothetical protein
MANLERAYQERLEAIAAEAQARIAARIAAIKADAEANPAGSQNQLALSMTLAVENESGFAVADMLKAYDAAERRRGARRRLLQSSLEPVARRMVLDNARWFKSPDYEGAGPLLFERELQTVAARMAGRIADHIGVAVWVDRKPWWNRPQGNVLRWGAVFILGLIVGALIHKGLLHR